MQVIDQFLVASRFRLKDMWKAAVVGTFYVVFNITYYYTAPAGEELIYYILDWGRDPWEAVTYSVVTVFVLVPLSGAFHLGVFRWDMDVEQGNFVRTTLCGRMVLH